MTDVTVVYFGIKPKPIDFSHWIVTSSSVAVTVFFSARGSRNSPIRASENIPTSRISRNRTILLCFAVVLTDISLF